MLKHKWYADVREDGKVYAATTIPAGGKRFKVYMHRWLTKCPKGLLVDHRDGNGLHNWRENLSIATLSQNAQNAAINLGAVPFRGVTLDRNNKSRPYRARINPDGEGNKHLGMFATAEEAARAYDEAAIRMIGPFAILNFPREEYAGARPAITEVYREEAIPFP